MCWNKKTEEQFIEELAIKRPDIRLVGAYTTNKTKTSFCHIACGHTWATAPNHILNDNSECPSCLKARPDRRTKSHETFVAQIAKACPLVKVIGQYTNAKEKVEILCENGHSSFSLPTNLLRGRYCTSCVEYRKFREQPITLYYVRLDASGGSFYKIGLTQRSIKARMKDFLPKFKVVVLAEIQYDCPEEAYALEQRIISESQQWVVSEPIARKGNTEIFTKDVLNLDIDGKYLYQLISIGHKVWVTDSQGTKL